ncbi:hypothetical protein MTO96_004077 [Rhipicephalus appendiculatus]
MEHHADALVAFLRDLGLGTFNDDAENPVELALMIDLYYDLKANGRPLLSMDLRTDIDFKQWRRERDHMRRENRYLDFVQRYINVILGQASVP